MKLVCFLVVTLFSAQLFGQNIERRFESPAQQMEWVKCFLITSSGDTLHGYVKHRDFSLYTNDVTKPRGVHFKYANASQKQFSDDELNEIYVMARDGNQRYLSTGERSKIIYRVIVDGPCKILIHLTEVVFKPEMPGQPPQEKEIYEKYTVYCKGIFSKSLSSYQYQYIPASFRKTCEQFFGDCPELATQIKNKKFKSEKLIDMVNEFNTCVSGK